MSERPPYSVLQVVPALDAGGVERTVLEVAEALIRDGHAAHVVSAGGRLVPELTAMGATHYTMDVGSKRLLAFPWRVAALRRLIHRTRADIVHARSRAPAWAAWRAAEAENRAFVTTYHGIYNAGFPGKRRYNSIMARGDLVIANSRYTAEHIVRTHGTPFSRIRTVPRGVDMARFDPARVGAADAQALRRSWGVPDGAPLIVLPGRLTRWKGQLEALDAMAHLPRDHHLALVGDAQGRDDYVREIGAAAALRGCEDRVCLPGHSEDMPTVLAAADVVICPSTDPEAFGRTAAEAQAMGRPVVASAHGGALEVVADGRTGWLVPPGDSHALADAILKARNLPDVGSWSRARIGRHFSTDAMRAGVLSAYAEVLARKNADSGSVAS